MLKVLQRAYFGKVKLIYIDPPYNTGNDSFIYPDRFQESKEDYLKRINELTDDGTLMREGFFRKNSRESGAFSLELAFHDAAAAVYRAEYAEGGWSYFWYLVMTMKCITYGFCNE